MRSNKDSNPYFKVLLSGEVSEQHDICFNHDHPFVIFICLITVITVWFIRVIRLYECLSQNLYLIRFLKETCLSHWVLWKNYPFFHVFVFSIWQPGTIYSNWWSFCQFLPDIMISWTWHSNFGLHLLCVHAWTEWRPILLIQNHWRSYLAFEILTIRKSQPNFWLRAT